MHQDLQRIQGLVKVRNHRHPMTQRYHVENQVRQPNEMEREKFTILTSQMNFIKIKEVVIVHESLKSLIVHVRNLILRESLRKKLRKEMNLVKMRALLRIRMSLQNETQKEELMMKVDLQHQSVLKLNVMIGNPKKVEKERIRLYQKKNEGLFEKDLLQEIISQKNLREEKKMILMKKSLD